MVASPSETWNPVSSLSPSFGKPDRPRKTCLSLSVTRGRAVAPQIAAARLRDVLLYAPALVHDNLASGRSVALVFFNPSLRTRASMQVGIYELGGNAAVLEPGGTSWTLEHRDGAVMDSDKTEHVAEFVRVLGRYCAAIGVRTFAALKDWPEERTDPVLNAFAKYSTVPVINLESAMHHPCQALADMMTIQEHRGAGRKRVLLTWAWHPKPLPMAVPNSFALATAQMGHDVVIAHPAGYELDDELMENVVANANAAGGSVPGA